MTITEARKINPKYVRRESWPGGESIEARPVCGRIFWDYTTPGLMVSDFHMSAEDESALDWNPVLGWLSGSYACTELNRR